MTAPFSPPSLPPQGTTEQADPRYVGLDTWPDLPLTEALWAGQSRAVSAVLPALPDLARAVAAAAARLKQGGTLIYGGAGTSGVLALLDGYELAPTFNWPQHRVKALLAGGLDLSGGISSAGEDDPDAGRDAVASVPCGPEDVVIGVSASGGSRFTVAILEEARRRGALTIAVTSAAPSALTAAADHVLLTPTGPEVIAGSTRLGAGTAQKVVLNTFSTAVMVRLGHVHDNLMVNVRPDNQKLRQRGIRILCRLTGVAPDTAAAVLTETGDIKVAVLVLGGVDPAAARAALSATDGHLRAAMHRTGLHRTGWQQP